MGKPVIPYLQHMPYSNVSTGTPKRLFTSRLTAEDSILPPPTAKHGPRRTHGKDITRTPFSSLSYAIHGKHAG
ncbi:hypothetical protein TNCV_3538581 [Trichonephila clavipes]|nr:hypothetical protein TNCV_3538581 [Trichonephila clavipes]